MTTHNISRADSLLAGKVKNAQYHKDSLAATYGLPADLPIYHNLGAPVVGDANGVSESQTINTTASLDGALVASGVAVMDVPRNIVGAWTNTATITITGTDVYGNTLVETSASGTSHAGTKAFATVTGVESSTSITSATIGTGDVLGLPFRIADKNQVTVKFDGAADAATVVAAVDTTATATTGDVRGTVDLAGTLNGAKTASVTILGADRTTKALAFGVDQFGG